MFSGTFSHISVFLFHVSFCMKCRSVAIILPLISEIYNYFFFLPIYHNLVSFCFKTRVLLSMGDSKNFPATPLGNPRKLIFAESFPPWKIIAISLPLQTSQFVAFFLGGGQPIAIPLSCIHGCLDWPKRERDRERDRERK